MNSDSSEYSDLDDNLFARMMVQMMLKIITMEINTYGIKLWKTYNRSYP